MGDIEEEIQEFEIPDSKRTKGFKEKGKINLSPEEKERVLNEIRARRPASIFENKSSINQLVPSKAQKHRVKVKEAWYDLSKIEKFLNDHKKEDYLHEQAKLQLEIAKLNNQSLEGIEDAGEQKELDEAVVNQPNWAHSQGLGIALARAYAKADTTD